MDDRGEAVRGRCKATNLCAYCARLGAVENAEVLALDALAGSAPEVWAVLTTRTATLETARFYRSRDQVLKALRRRWPACEVASLVEFTTGYGPRSGGDRRPHWNLLIKGVPREDVDQAREVIVGVWCSREDARPEGQHVGAIGEVGGLMRYLALHFQKESQQPPEGWRGHRFLKTRGYLGGSTAAAREAARASLRHKRELWRAIRAGLQGEAAELEAAWAVEEAAERSWRLVHLNTKLLAGSATPRPPRTRGEGEPARVARDATPTGDRWPEADPETGRAVEPPPATRQPAGTTAERAGGAEARRSPPRAPATASAPPA